jgi:outer membrane protein OmpU
MRNLLLGSTALAVALTAADAFAADGIKLGIGGRYKGAAGVNAIQDFNDFDNTVEHPRTYVFKQDVEVHFLGEATLDNGLTVGARVELEGQTSSDQIDAVYAYFSGGFGEIRLGDTEEAYAQFCYLVPSASELFGADSPDFNFSNAGLLGYGATNGTCYGVDDHSTKLVYFSPTFAGFSFAASFTPDNTEDTRNTVAGAATRPDNNPGQNSENLSVAANFTHDFNDINVILGGGATWSFDAENNGDPVTHRSNEASGYNAYARIGFAGFTFGGAMEIRDNFATGGADQIVYGAGATYAWDAWTIGLGWTHGDYELYGGPGDVTENHDIFSLTAAYALGPGITLDGVVEYDMQDFGGNGVAGNPDGYEGLAFGMGTFISF